MPCSLCCPRFLLMLTSGKHGTSDSLCSEMNPWDELVLQERLYTVFGSLDNEQMPVPKHVLGRNLVVKMPLSQILTHPCKSLFCCTESASDSSFCLVSHLPMFSLILSRIGDSLTNLEVFLLQIGGTFVDDAGGLHVGPCKPHLADVNDTGKAG